MWNFTRIITFPWQKTDATDDETSPLLSKVHSNKDIEDDTQYETLQTNNAQTARAQKEFKRYCFSPFYYFLKYFYLICNIIFTILGLTVLGLGMWGLVTKESFAQENIGAIAADPMLVLVSAGLLLFALCVFGCVAVLRENLCLMKTFAFILVVLISIEALLVIFVEFFKNEISASMRSSMLAGIVRYQDDLDVRFIMDEIQSNLQCCGVDTYRDWQLNIYYNCSAPGVLACGVPPTCCVDPLENGTVWNSQCGVGALAMDEFTAQSVVFLGGCLGSLSRWAEEHRLAIVIPEGLVFAVQILGVFIIARLMDSIYSYQKYINNYYRPGL